MQTIKQNIMQAHNLLCYDDHPNVCFFKNIYKFTNENIKGLFDNFDIEGKKCLTVLGSGDQTLDLLLRGASSVTAFDINPLTRHYLNLKMALLKSDVSIEEYMRYLCWTNSENKKNEYFFDKKIYDKIKYNLYLGSMLFWNTIYNCHDDSISTPDRLFKYDENKYTVLKRIIKYLDNKEFDNMKAMISSKKIDFINTDITRLASNLHEKYDLIYLSNIIAYTKNIFEIDENNEIERKIKELKRYSELIKELSQHLNKDGKIIVGYVYEPDTFSHKYAINDYYSRTQIFETQEYDTITFEGINAIIMQDMYSFVPNFKNEEEDACIIYTKR